MELPGRHIMLDSLAASITEYELAYLLVKIANEALIEEAVSYSKRMLFLDRLPY